MKEAKGGWGAKGFDSRLRMELYAHRVWRACTCGAVINWYADDDD
jgi:hypothetical protein